MPDVMKDTTDITDPKLLVRRAYDEFATKAAGVTRSDDTPDQKVLSNLLERLESGASVLDAGCGNGLPVARRLVEAGLRVTGIDLSEGQLAKARLNVPEASYRLMDMEEAILPAESFDAIVSYYAILHVPRNGQQNVLRNFHRMLKPGGYAFLGLADSDDEAYISELGPVKEMFFSHFSAETYLQMVAMAGFTVLWFDIVADSTDAKAKHLFVLLRK